MRVSLNLLKMDLLRLVKVWIFGEALCLFSFFSLVWNMG